MSDKVHKDDFGSELAVGDIVYIGKGHWQDAHFAVIRALVKSMHTVRISVRTSRVGQQWVKDGYEGVEDHVSYGARSLLKMQPDWLSSLPNQELANAVFNERDKVLGGEYDKKKTKK
jgi:hypothetical protein